MGVKVPRHAQRRSSSWITPRWKVDLLALYISQRTGAQLRRRPDPNPPGRVSTTPWRLQGEPTACVFSPIVLL